MPCGASLPHIGEEISKNELHSGQKMVKFWNFIPSQAHLSILITLFAKLVLTPYAPRKCIGIGKSFTVAGSLGLSCNYGNTCFHSGVPNPVNSVHEDTFL